MKLAPIRNSFELQKNCYKTKINKNNKHSTQITPHFKGTDKKTVQTINSDYNAISNSIDFRRRMTELRAKSLEKRMSFDYFLTAAITAYNKNAINFPIKEDFFGYKTKARFTEVIKKYLNHEIEQKLNNYLADNYYWGLFTDKKYGGSEAFTTAILCISPYAKGYEVELGMLKLKDLEKKEKALRAEIDKQDKIIDIKEQIGNEYFKPAQAAQKNSEIILPNSIMIECTDGNIANEIMQWTLSNTPTRPIAIGTNPDDSNLSIKNKLKSALENARKTYENYHTLTLIYCENFDKLLQATNTPAEIAGIKALLSNTYEKYHATIIFTTNDPNKIDNVLKQPHRMKQIKTGKY